MDYFINLIDGSKQEILGVVLQSMKHVGLRYPSLLVQHKNLVVKLKDNPGLHDICTALLDLIEGRRLILL